MGKKVSADEPHFVSFKPNNGGFTVFLPMDSVLSGQQDSEAVMKEAGAIYERSVRKMRVIVAEMEGLRAAHARVPARKMWQLGDVVFRLVEDLKRQSLELDGVYEHLCRDLQVKRKWLEKAIIFRRYLPDQDVIPQSLNWGRCEKGTRRIAELLLHGTLPSDVS